MHRIRERLASFRHAGRGVLVLLGEANARIHLLVAVAVLLLGLYLKINATDWALLFLCITIVLAAEAINTALERIVDLASPAWSHLARDAKDLAAGSVLIAAIGAVAVGLAIFIPYL